MEIDVIIEIPQVSRNKYEMDHDTGQIRLDRTSVTAEIGHFFDIYKK